MKEQLIKEILFYPAFDRRDPDPNKNYGVHGVEARFILHGKKGAVQFLLFTNWMLPNVQAEQDMRHDNHLLCRPIPADLGYHSLKPHYKGQKKSQDHCEFLNGKPCYYDGSGLAAEEIYGKLLTGGSDAVWMELESYYHRIFEPETLRIPIPDLPMKKETVK